MNRNTFCPPKQGAGCLGNCTRRCGRSCSRPTRRCRKVSELADASPSLIDRFSPQLRHTYIHNCRLRCRRRRWRAVRRIYFGNRRMMHTRTNLPPRSRASTHNTGWRRRSASWPLRRWRSAGCATSPSPSSDRYGCLNTKRACMWMWCSGSWLRLFFNHPKPSPTGPAGVALRLPHRHGAGGRQDALRRGHLRPRPRAVCPSVFDSQ